MNLLYGQDARVARWVLEHAPHGDGPWLGHYIAVGVEDEGELIAGWVFNEYRGHSIHCSMASTSPRWCSRRTLEALFSYPFVQLKCKRLTAYTGKSMANVRAFLTRLGFAQEGIMRSGYVDDDCVIYGLLREECRWVNRTFQHEPIRLLPVAAACA